jgi:hypothetical protein
LDIVNVLASIAFIAEDGNVIALQSAGASKQLRLEPRLIHIGTTLCSMKSWIFWLALPAFFLLGLLDA